MSFVIGETVGPYRITEQLGSGGMATVFKAYHSSLDRYVAIKVLHPAFKGDPEFLARFQREARVVANLDHNNIVPVFDFSEHEGRPYLVMRFIEGETLKARLGGKTMPVREALAIIKPVGEALHYAHVQGVLHRDVKPSNVMLTPDDDVFLTDFGLARVAQAGESTMSQDSMLGTPQYISPEQAKGESNLDGRTDVYSLGVVLYELLVGQVPYQADTPFAVVHDHIFTPLPMPRVKNPDLPEPLERFLLKALAKEPDERFSSVEEMMSSLDNAVADAGSSWLGSQPVVPTSSSSVARRVSGAQSTVTAVARRSLNPLLWVGLGGLIVLATVAVVLLSRQPPGGPPRPNDAAQPPPPAEDRPAPPPNSAAPLPSEDGPVDEPPPDSEPPPDFEREQEAQGLLEEANQLFMQGNQLVQRQPERARASYAQAAEVAEHGLEVVPEFELPQVAELHVLAAQSWLAAGQPEHAEAHFAWLVEMIGRDEERAPVLAGLAGSHLLQGRPEEAIALSDEALAIDPEFAAAHAMRACALRQIGERAEAVQALREIGGPARIIAALPPWARLALSDIDCGFER